MSSIIYCNINYDAIVITLHLTIVKLAKTASATMINNSLSLLPELSLDPYCHYVRTSVGRPCGTIGQRDTPPHCSLQLLRSHAPSARPWRARHGCSISGQKRILHARMHAPSTHCSSCALMLLSPTQLFACLHAHACAAAALQLLRSHAPSARPWRAFVIHAIHTVWETQWAES
jgi:hypothetical protein